MARPENLKERRRSDAGHQDQNIDLAFNETDAEAQGGWIILDGQFAKRGGHQGAPPVAFDKPGHLGCHPTLECSNRDAREALLTHRWNYLTGASVAQRKPVDSLRIVGSLSTRVNIRTVGVSFCHPEPRRTRFVPDSGPFGFFAGLFS